MTAGSGEWAPDFPVMAERIDYASDSPVVLFAHRIDLLGTGANRTSENGIGVSDGQDDSDCDASQGFWAEVMVLGRFVAQPEFGAAD